MSKLAWDATGERLYETGVKNGVLYPMSSSGTYPLGVAWNGLVSISETPSGAESNPQYADDIKYLDLTSKEEFGATIEAFTYPDEFAECDGSKEVSDGVFIGQQARKPFGLSYVTTVGNDTEDIDHGYKIHLVYGCKATPSERAYQTINDSPEAITFSWEITTTPPAFTTDAHKDFKPTAIITIDSTKVDSEDLDTLKDAIWGTNGEGQAAGTDPYLPLPDAVLAMFE